MSLKNRSDVLAEALAIAMRDAFRQWYGEHGMQRGMEMLWTQDIVKINLSGHYTPNHRGVMVVEVVSKRPGRSELYPYSIEPGRGRATLERKESKSQP